tara:strand:- start:24215 stop:25102 length:888 start_codon:yes stop_codon:yes gene_type:complete
MSLVKPASTPYDFFEPTSKVVPTAINMVGFEFDGTACFRKGTVEGPNALREVSFGIESYSPYQEKDIEEQDAIYDLGNLVVGNTNDIDQNWQIGTDNFFKLFSKDDIKNNTRVITIGGEHSISYAPIKTYLETFDELVLLHLDAHADLRDGYEGHHYSHASIIRRALDHFKPGHELIQYGIRSGTKDEYKYMNEHRTIRKSLEDFLNSVKSISDERPIYLTLDLDYFDPSFFPGTGTPEPGGETFHSFISLIKILTNKNFVGCDVVELSPSIDKTGNSSVFAAKVIRELSIALSR